MKNNKTLQRETKSVINDMNFDKVLSKRNELDNVNDLWYFVKSAKNRWIAGSAH
ncbi:putative exported peptide YydF [Streptococcus infantarius subsp. infantarius]|nr:putative exported peptide YydF [Streptococcus infantarius subsp. infantarius]MCO4638612.1 putative exported peptide YydF [Streptococcus infantarius subsp. infantarius]MCO4641005.1 putative exported peptide YydF [Streptococcus infantarius subsp. infantarius]